jgi:L-amino acid N-acyltransferase YncA
MEIRVATPGDAPGVRAIYAPFVESTAVSFEERPPSAEEMAGRIEASHLWLVADEGGEVQGFAYAGRFHPRPAYRWATEVSIYLAESARGKGLGKTLLRDLLARLTDMGFVSAFAGTTLPNDASVTLFESFGFKKIALWDKVGYKLGTWHDVGWWQLHLREPGHPPPELKLG